MTKASSGPERRPPGELWEFWKGCTHPAKPGGPISIEGYNLADFMTLSPGTKLGPYEILAPLGAGGMGEVYRACDTRLQRTVAIKILPLQFSSDPVRNERFEREAKTISNLNHPHICVLYDIGHQNLIQKFLARNDAFGILYHEFQGLEFLCRKRNWLTTTRHLHLRKAHAHIIKNKCVSHIDPRRAPQGGAHTREQLPWAERLGHVVIGTNFQEQDFVQHIRFCAKHNDWKSGRGLCDLPTDLLP